MAARINLFQQRVLEAVSELADQHPCLESIYIFGSVGRGETEQANDIDLSADYVSNIENFSVNESYVKFQSLWNDWALAASERLQRPVRWAHIYLDDKNDPTWQAIIHAAENPVARIGKAVLVATPRTKTII